MVVMLWRWSGRPRSCEGLTNPVQLLMVPGQLPGVSVSCPCGAPLCLGGAAVGEIGLTLKLMPFWSAFGAWRADAYPGRARPRDAVRCTGCTERVPVVLP